MSTEATGPTTAATRPQVLIYVGPKNKALGLREFQRFIGGTAAFPPALLAAYNNSPAFANLFEDFHEKFMKHRPPGAPPLRGAIAPAIRKGPPIRVNR